MVIHSLPFKLGELQKMSDISKDNVRDRLGNVDQIRDLLFGQKIKEYDQRYENSTQRLDRIETELSQFQTEIRDRLTSLQESLTTEIRSGLDSLEKQLKYLSLTTHEQTSKLQQEIHLVEQKNVHGLESLQKAVTSQNNFFKHDLSHTREKLEEDILFLKGQVVGELEQGLAQLKEAKLSRIDLADVLFELCLKIKGTEFVPNLKEGSENHLKTDFLLPEQHGSESQH
jgi:exonuclease VII large subunit